MGAMDDGLVLVRSGPNTSKPKEGGGHRFDHFGLCQPQREAIRLPGAPISPQADNVTATLSLAAGKL